MQKRSSKNGVLLMSKDMATIVSGRLDEEYRLCAQDFWYFAQFISTHDEERGIVRPYPLNFDYLRRYHKEIMDNQKVVTLKSRRMLISLHEITFKLWRAKFAGQNLAGAVDIYHGGYSATDEDLAKYQMGRIKEMHSSLPLWLQDRNPLVQPNTLFHKFEHGGIIQGFPMKRQGPQGFGFSDFTFDEMAWQEAARTCWKGLVPTIGIGNVRAISTPNGREGLGRFFYEVWKDVDQMYSGLHRVKIHWQENPEHTQEWYDTVTSGLKKWEIQQMYEMSFVSMAGKPVWPEFDRLIHVPSDAESIIPGRPIYLGWDFGFHNPAFCISQRNTRDQWVLHREYLKEDIDFDDFCIQCREYAGGMYDRKDTPEIHYVDPAGFGRYSNRAKSGASSDVHAIKLHWAKGSGGREVIVRPGALQTGTRTSEAPRLKDIRTLWKEREGDRRPGILINSQMEKFIDGCGGGYNYPERGHTEEPEKNSYSHIQDAVQYIVSGYNRDLDPAKYAKRPHQRRKDYARFREMNKKYRAGV